MIKLAELIKPLKDKYFILGIILTGLFFTRGSKGIYGPIFRHFKFLRLGD